MTDTKPPEATCTIRTEFVGIPLPPCGKAAEVVAEGRCPNGHSRRRPLCGDHRDAFEVLPSSVVCEQCDAVGVEAVMTVTIGGAP